MFGWTEIAALYDEPTRLAIIPTFILPFTIVGMVLTSVATWVAALFGIELHTEGPRRFFEVFLKPKFLLMAVLSNLCFLSLYKGYSYVKHHSYPIWWIEYQNPLRSLPDTGKLQTQILEQSKSTPSEISTGANLKFTKVWETDLHNVTFAALVPHDDSIFVSHGGGAVTQLNAADGSIQHEFKIGQPIMTPALIYDGTLFVGEGVHETHHARMYAFDLKTGQLKNSVETPGHIERAAIQASWGNKDLILFPAGSGGLYAVHRTSLQVLWKAKLGHIDATPVVSDNRVFVATGEELGDKQKQTEALSIELTTGKVMWSQSLPTSSWGIPVLWKDQVCFSVGDVYKSDSQFGQFACFRKDKGQKTFSIDFDSPLLAKPLIRGNKAILSDFAGKVYQVDLDQQKIEWTIATPQDSPNYASAVVDDQDRLIMPGKEGIYIYDLKTQKLLATWKPQDSWPGALANVLIQNNVWYISNAKGVVTAFTIQ